MHLKTSLYFPTLGLTLALALFSVTPASACGCYCDQYCQAIGDCCPWCLAGGEDSMVTATLTPNGPDQARLIINNVITTEMVTATNCVAGIEEVPGMASVDGLRLINIANGALLYDFFANEASSDSFEELAESRPRPSAVEHWSGFHGVVPQDIPDGTVAAFAIDLTLEQGTSLQTLAENLQRSGDIAGGSGTDEGALDFHHYFVRALRNIPIAVDSRSELERRVP